MEKEQNSRDRWLTEQEEARLLMAAAAWLREVVTFAVNTGMRRGEILALTWAGVDFTRRTVTVFKSKNGERRTIPVKQTVLDLLSHKYEQSRGLRELKLGVCSAAKPVPSWTAATFDEDLPQPGRRHRLRIFTSTIYAIPLPHGWSTRGWTYTKSSGCSGTNLRT
jgi:integrase